MKDKDWDKFLERKRRVQRQKEKRPKEREEYNLPSHIENKLHKK